MHPLGLYTSEKITMNVKSIIIVVIGLLVSVTAYSQQPKETTMDLLTHTVWEHGKPIYGDYRQMVYTDSTATMLCQKLMAKYLRLLGGII